MTTLLDSPIFTFSTRTEPVTDVERTAALRAIHRVLVYARCLAQEGGADSATFEAIFDGLHNLPTCLLRPNEFEDLFRPSLEGLVKYLPAVHGVIVEFDRALGR